MLEHVMIDRSTNAKRSVLSGALVALGVLIGMLVIWTPGAEATNGPDGPERVFALTINDKLVRFDGDNPSRVNSKDITGLVADESLVGIDFRPSAQPPGSPNQGKLYGVGDRGYIYTIDSKTAVATRGPRITADLDGDGDTESVALRGDRFGIDFNPVVDRLRIVSEANQNLRVNVDTGALADFDPVTPGTQPDRDLQYAAGDPNAGQDPNVTGVAYRNSQPSAFDADPTTVDPGKTTELYDIDARTDDMSEQDPPNNGTLITEGSLGVNTNQLIGFDIVTRGASPSGDRGYAALNAPSRGGSKFYKINLNTGDATKIGTIASGSAKVEGLAIPIGQM
jgi:hypothetical protein